MSDETKLLDDGGPAYPSEQGSCPDGTWNQTFNPGMTLRDWFAGMAMQALIANDDQDPPWNATTASQYAYVVADAMLEERAKRR